MLFNNNLTEIYNKYREGKLAHAYLIETNNPQRLLEDLKKLIQAINCPAEFSEKCQACNLCNLIAKDNLPSLITIEPDGTSIKKAQIEALKLSFETKPIYSKYNVYIIKNAEKLNSSSANAMLKFVEEPTEGILGFFITNNKDVIIPTIKSRCQIIVVTYENNNLLEKLNITSDELESYKQLIKDYLKKIKTNEFINNKDFILSKYKERSEIDIMFKIMFEVYYNIFLKSLNKPYNEELIEIDKIGYQREEICFKLNIISKLIQELSYNVNMELLLDKFVIEMRKQNG
ncbi:dNA polymerase III delta prime subunit [Mycoplasma sp. CAG:776]|nr:dNA polymerase III delta prime subunit [Mycoplasma sp. CAG:776]